MSEDIAMPVASRTVAVTARARVPRPRERARLAKARLERRGRVVTGVCAAFVVALVLSLIVLVASHGLATFAVDGVSFASFVTGTVWNPHASDASGAPYMGALPMICGSFVVTMLSCAMVLPIAIGCAIFVVEIAPRFGERVFRPITEMLAGIPSVVFGLIGLTVLVPIVRGFAGGTGFGILSGSLVLACMVFPTVVALINDAIAAVPRSYREGSYGLGCTRWQTVLHVVLPSAMPGIMTAIVLGMARAFGEALAVQMVIGNAAQMPASLFTPAATLTSVLTTSMGNEAMGTVYNDALWSLALILLVMSLVFILIVRLIGRAGKVRGNA